MFYLLRISMQLNLYMGNIRNVLHFWNLIHKDPRIPEGSFARKRSSSDKLKIFKPHFYIIVSYKQIFCWNPLWSFHLVAFNVSYLSFHFSGVSGLVCMWYFSPAWLFGLEHSGLTIKEYFRSARSIRYKFIGGKLIEFIRIEAEWAVKKRI